MKTDSRGRVRFTHGGTRFEVNKNGVRGYIRYTSFKGVERERAEGSIDFSWTLLKSFSSAEFRTKFSEALGELRIYENDPCRFTKDIFIPRHMRAVQ